MIRRMLPVLALAAALSPVQAASLPGQASHYCTFSRAADLDKAAASAASPYLGVFDGRWNGTLPVTLIIYEVRDSRASGYYAWGNAAAWHVKAGCSAVHGRIVNNTLQFHGADTMSFTQRGTGLNGVYVFQPGTANELIEHSRFARKR